MRRTVLTFDELTSQNSVHSLIDNSGFMPVSTSQEFEGSRTLTLRTRESEMTCLQGTLGRVDWVDRRADLFPCVELTLVTAGGHLIPVCRGLVRSTAGQSYWDVVFSPGKVWTEPEDHSKHRVVLPFLLCNELENDTHHGLACFLFDDGGATDWRIQIAVQTKPFMVGAEFDVVGVVALESSNVEDNVHADVVDAYANECRDHLLTQSFSTLAERVAPELLDNLHQGFGADTVVVQGIVDDDVIYVDGPHTRAGDYPFVDAIPFGLWSATKTAFGALACLRLSHILGEDCRTSKIADVVDDAPAAAGWQDVTIGDCLNMASGIGTVESTAEPPQVFADYILEASAASASDTHAQSYRHYFDWFIAHPKHLKNNHAFDCPSYPWGPGEVARYRDQDLYMAGVAMDAVLKTARGREARLWDMLRDEVYAPLGIRHAVNFHTREVQETDSVPLTNSGLLLSIQDIAKLGRLLHQRGRLGDEQLLSPSLTEELLDPRVCKGLPTGTQTSDGETYYHFATWHRPYKALSGESFWLPTMHGYGGQVIQILPNGMTTFRFAYDDTQTDDGVDVLKLPRIADALRPFI